jgi:tRNA A-37 threonylcarbamoyl transferase component Bud32
MAELPFQILIKSASGKTETLTCTALLRAIPGRREVYDALWNQRAVIVKLFSHKVSAKRHLNREWRGLKLLQKRGLNSPEPLFFGQTEDGRWTLIMEKITNSLTALEVFNKTVEKNKRLDLMVLICKELAKEHDKGIFQKDTHLENFLLDGDKVFMLDPGQMKFSSHQVTRSKSISQLAALASCLVDSDTKSVSGLCEEYIKARGWHFTKSDKILFQKQLIVQRKRAIRKGLKKCLRTSKRYVRINAGENISVFDKDFCQGADPLDFIKQIDSIMDKGQILKDGNTCYVSRLTWNSKDMVVKRYNHKGFIHSLRHTIKRSRAYRSWLHTHRLSMLNIATPKGLAYIEQRKGLLVWKSYLVAEYVQGQKLYDFLRNKVVAQEQRSKVTLQIKELLDKLGKHRISHGDLKHTNILITESGPVLTDLDGMKTHKLNWTYQRYRAKDHARILKNWPQGTVVSLQEIS